MPNLICILYFLLPNPYLCPMPTTLNPPQRSYCMSRIRGKDTKPEILVRRGLHARGFRFRLQDRGLPGTPDIVLPKYGVVIMVNGCFWHGHKGCRYATRPKSNSEFWQAKIQRNKHRDEVTAAHLEALGWHVIVVWECELRRKADLEGRLNELASEITAAGEIKRRREESRKQSRLEMKRMREEMLRRQARLEAEVEAMFPIPRRIKQDSKL